jgi:hypothetical protein
MHVRVSAFSRKIILQVPTTAPHMIKPRA